MIEARAVLRDGRFYLIVCVGDRQLDVPISDQAAYVLYGDLHDAIVEHTGIAERTAAVILRG